MNETDTCRTYVLPKLKTAGWEDEWITGQLLLTAVWTVKRIERDQARLASLRELQSQTQEELDALLPSALDRAFRGEL